MGETSRNPVKKILAFAAVVEIGTGVGLMADPAIVVTLLLGADIAGTGIPLGRCLGIALLALGLACWPGRQDAGSGSPPIRGMITYNALLALFLAYLGTVGHFGGVLLWPAVALHAVVAMLLLWPSRNERRPAAADR